MGVLVLIVSTLTYAAGVDQGRARCLGNAPTVVR